jgi:hypothetical protein
MTSTPVMVSPGSIIRDVQIASLLLSFLLGQAHQIFNLFVAGINSILSCGSGGFLTALCDQLLFDYGYRYYRYGFK